MIPGTHPIKKIYVRWAPHDEDDDERVLWISGGGHRDDFYSFTIAINEKNVGKLLSELKNLLEKSCRRKRKS